MTTGVYELLLRDDPAVFAYLRRGEGEALLVVANFYADPTEAHLSEGLAAEFPSRTVLLTNDGAPQELHDGSGGLIGLALRPYEAIVFHLVGA
jgi:trehalose-6-phosphate hydrolase